MEMNLAIEPSGDRAVVQATGSLNLLTAVKLKQSLTRLVEEGIRRLVVDLGDVPFIDTSGLGALISGLKAARLAGGDLRLARADARARQLLNITSLDRVLTVHESVDDALEALDGLAAAGRERQATRIHGAEASA